MIDHVLDWWSKRAPINRRAFGFAGTGVVTIRNRPMTHILSKRRTVLLLIFTPFLLLSACKTGGETQAPDLTAGSPADSQTTGVISAEGDVAFGPGDFILAEPAAGLSDLSSYTATLSLSFAGTEAGESSQWSKTYVMLASQEPLARWLTTESSGDLPDLDAVFMAEADGAAYERLGENACTAIVIEQGNSLGERLEPAGFLTGVIGAEEAGSETVNDTAANHYTFDQRALGQSGLAESTGEMWVASEGGYIVRYLVTTQGDATYFGEGIEGTLTWDYELTEVNGTINIDLPADCPAGMVDAPLLPDASNVLNVPSVLAYETASSPADVAAFYQEEIPGLGWTLVEEPNITDTVTSLDFTRGEEALTVLSSAGDGGTKVHILLDRSSGLAVTVDPPVTATGETPLLPDATNVVNAAGLLSYQTASTPEEATTFYKDQLPALGWTLVGETNMGSGISITFTMSEKTMSILIAAVGSSTYITITTG